MGNGGKVMFEDIPDESKAEIIKRWNKMSETDKAHFINQVALALSVWGSDQKGRELVVEVLRFMTNNGTKTLADFGIYVDKLTRLKRAAGRVSKIKRAGLILEGYRIKHGLSSVPHIDIS
jgi:hypothetical protein